MRMKAAAQHRHLPSAAVAPPAAVRLVRKSLREPALRGVWPAPISPRGAVPAVMKAAVVPAAQSPGACYAMAPPIQSLQKGSSKGDPLPAMLHGLTRGPLPLRETRKETPVASRKPLGLVTPLPQCPSPLQSRKSKPQIKTPLNPPSRHPGSCCRPNPHRIPIQKQTRNPRNLRKSLLRRLQERVQEKLQKTAPCAGAVLGDAARRLAYGPLPVL